MSTAKKSRRQTIVWFEIPADNVDRAKTFYRKLFGWKINPFPTMPDYQHIDTSGQDASPDGGLMTRRYPGKPSPAMSMWRRWPNRSQRWKSWAARSCVPKSAVPQMGYFAVCQDTEGNTFALWEMNQKAK